MNSIEKTCIVNGAASQPASWLIPALVAQGWRVHMLSRGIAARDDYGPNATWHDFDFLGDKPMPSFQASVVFHAAEINYLVPHLQLLKANGVARILAFSSTSRFTKVASSSSYDRAVVDRLQGAEDKLIAGCEALDIPWTIFRPTMIYGGKRPKGVVADISRIIRMTGGWFPLVGAATGLRQPVHAADLAIAAIQAATAPAARNRDFNLSGAERLSFRHMVERIYSAMGRKPRFIRLPVSAFQAAIAVVKLHPRYHHISKATALRMLQDMVFDHDAATAAFGFSPVPFIPLQPYPDTSLFGPSSPGSG